MTIVTAPEEWRDVVGYEGRYQVSNLGRVKSLPNKRRNTELIMKQTKFKKSNHLLINLTTNVDGWTQKVHYVHRLVLEAFVGPCPTGMEACHNDGDAANNSLGNLRWDTHEQNGADTRKHGSLRGSNNGMAVLNDSAVLNIKSRLARGEHDAEIASDFGVSPHTVKNIRNGYTWSHV